MLVRLGAGVGLLLAKVAAPAAPAVNPDRVWLDSLPSALKLELRRYGLVAKELRRSKPRVAGH